MSHLTHKGYSAIVTFEADSDVFVGRLAGIDDIITFEADNTKALKSAFIEAVNDYLKHCKTMGKPPKKSYSGKMMLRVSPKIHAQTAEQATLAQMSINEFAEQALKEKINNTLL